MALALVISWKTTVNHEKVIGSKTVNFPWTSCVKSLIISAYLDLTTIISDYLDLTTIISDNLDLTTIISDYLDLTTNISDYLDLTTIISDYLDLTTIIPDYLDLTTIISDYLDLTTRTAATTAGNSRVSVGAIVGAAIASLIIAVLLVLYGTRRYVYMCIVFNVFI